VTRRDPRPGVRRPGRTGSRGQSIVMVALAGVALMGMTGLALDGGYEAGKYRAAQNAADAGALAAARAVYESNAGDSTSTLCSTTPAPPSLPSGIAPLEVVHNHATPSCIVKKLTTYAPAGPDGLHSYAALATVDSDTNVAVPPLSVADVKAHVGVNETTGDVVVNPTPTASGSVDLVGLQASDTILGIPIASGNGALFTCSSSASGYGTSQTTPAGGGTCPTSSLSVTLAGVVNVNAALSLSMNVPGLLQQSSSSHVWSTGVPQQRGFSRMVNGTLSQLGVVNVATTDGTTISVAGSLGGATTGVRSSTSLTNVAATILGTSISLDALDATATVSWDRVNGFQAKTSCVLGVGNVDGKFRIARAGFATVDVAIGADCNYTLVNIPGVLTIGPTRTINCQAGPNGQVCTADVCVLNVQVLSVLAGVNSLSVCLGRATATADFKPVTQNSGVVVTATIPTPTFFMPVLGVLSTSPTATAGAVPRQVTDVSAAAFAVAPYAVSDLATERAGGAGFCSVGSFGPLQPGCAYTVWGPNVDANPYVEGQICSPAGTQCWQGQLSSTSSHAQGQTTPVTPISAAGTGPAPLLSGSTYILLPVIDPNGYVVFYGLFQSTADPHIYKLARTPDPAATPNVLAPLAQSETTGDWVPTDDGAVAIKLVDVTSYFAGWGTAP
jgi:hypothetical protein